MQTHQNFRLIFQYGKMTPDKWTRFAESIDELIEQSPLLGFIDTINYNISDLNFYWTLIREIITTAAKQHIPLYRVNLSRQHLNIKKKTETQNDLGKLNRIFHWLKTATRKEINVD